MSKQPNPSYMAPNDKKLINVLAGAEAPAVYVRHLKWTLAHCFGGV